MLRSKLTQLWSCLEICSSGIYQRWKWVLYHWLGIGADLPSHFYHSSLCGIIYWYKCTSMSTCTTSHLMADKHWPKLGQYLDLKVPYVVRTISDGPIMKNEKWEKRGRSEKKKRIKVKRWGEEDVNCLSRKNRAGIFRYKAEDKT